MVCLKSGWEIHRRATLGLSWQLIVPIEDKIRNNPVYGEKQKMSYYEKTESSILFVWDRVISERAGELDIKVAVEITVEDDRVIWKTKITNNSPYIVESVASPCIGDLSYPENSQQFQCFFPSYNSGTTNLLWPTFDDNCGYWGTDNPTNYIRGVPEAAYVLLHNNQQGLYCGVDEDSCEVVSWRSELRPGCATGLTYTVPKTETVDDELVHFRFSAIQCPYIQPNEQRMLTPIFLQAYEGDWQNGVDIYKKWAQSKGLDLSSDIPSWAQEPHSWFQYQINSPEDELRLSFKELPQLALECIKNNIEVIQLVGWNEGGQDRGNPNHRPDPRLGTVEELKQAIQECQQMGVKIVLFTKYTWADQSDPWYKNGGQRFAAKNPYGDPYWIDGYFYQTPTQQLGISARPLIPMCFSSDEYRALCLKEFQSTVELGCDGILYDECQHHGPALLCFDTSHGHRWGAPIYENDRNLIEEFKKETILPETFLFCGEACYDWETTQYHMSYHRSQQLDYLPVTRYTRPYFPMMTAVTGFDDRNMINQCLLYRFIVSYEPYNFKGRPSDARKTMEYGKIAHQFRLYHREYLWDAEFCGTKNVTVTTLDGQCYAPYSVYKTKNGDLAVLIVNYTDKAIEVQVQCEERQFQKYRTIDDATWHTVKNNLFLPMASAILVI